MAAPAVRQHQVLYRRPPSLTVIRDADDWSPTDPAISLQPPSPLAVAHSPTNALTHHHAGAPTPRNFVGPFSGSTPSTAADTTNTTSGRRNTPQHTHIEPRQTPKQRQHYPQLQQRSANGSLSGQPASLTSDDGQLPKAVARPASADAVPGSGVATGSGGASGGGNSGSSYSARLSGGAPNLNAAAAALAERQAMSDMLSAFRSAHRGRADGGRPSSSLGSGRKDAEALAEELHKTRAALASSQEQNRILRTERQRLEEELGRQRASLVKAEELLNTREKALGPNSAMSCMYRTSATTALIHKLREQLMMQQAQTESLKAQLDELMRGTRATRVSELQAEVKAQDQELRRLSEMVKIMRRRMEDAEAKAAQATHRGLEAERLARLQVPLAVLHHAVAVSEVKLSSSVAKLEKEKEMDNALGDMVAATLAANTGGGSGGIGRSPARGARGGSGGGGEGHSGGGAAAGEVTTPDGSSRLAASLTVAGAQSLSSSRVRKTMAVLGDAHRALLSQATLLSEIFPPGLTTEQLSIRAALRPATSGAPEVLRYLRHHVHRLVDVMLSLPGSRLEFVPEDEGAGAAGGGGGGSAGWSSPAARRGRNGRLGPARASYSGSGATPRAGGKARISGGGGSGGGAAPAVAAAGSSECDPWDLVGELLDFVRWLRGMDIKSLQSRPDLESGLEQVANLVGVCGTETKRLLGGGNADQEEAP